MFTKLTGPNIFRFSSHGKSFLFKIYFTHVSLKIKYIIGNIMWEGILLKNYVYLNLKMFLNNNLMGWTPLLYEVVPQPQLFKDKGIQNGFVEMEKRHTLCKLLTNYLFTNLSVQIVFILHLMENLLYLKLFYSSLKKISY